MRRLMLLRHAKTETDAPSGQDQDRRLDNRGRTDAAEIGGWIAAPCGDRPSGIAPAPRPGTRGEASGARPARGEDANTARNEAARSTAARSAAVRWLGTSAESLGAPSTNISSAAVVLDDRSLAIF